MDKVRVGIIGVGNIGTTHANILTGGDVEEGVLTAVCDINSDKLDAFKEKYGDSIARYEDYHDLLNSGLVDAVIVATPHYSHPKIGIDVLEAGLHLLSEKPIGVYTEQVLELYEVALRHPNLVFGIDYNQRTNSKYQKIRELVKNGEIGEIERVVFEVTDWFRTQAYFNSGGWRATWAGEGGGVLLNQDPHQLDLWQWICGMPCKVRGFVREAHYHDIEVEDDVTAYVEYPNGASGVFITTTGEYPGTNRFEITGTKGQIIFEDNGDLRFRKLKVDSKEYLKNSTASFNHDLGLEETLLEVEQKGEQHKGIIKDFLSAILHETPLLAPGIEGINGLSISNAIYLSAWKNEIVELPNDGKEFYELLKEKIKNSRLNTEVNDIVVDTAESYGNKQ